MHSLLIIAAFLPLVFACAPNASPEAKGPSADEIQSRLLRISESALAAKKSADKPALPWETLATMLPDSLGTVTATGAATGHVDATTTHISKAKRSYSHAAQAVKIELMDVTRAPGVMLAFMLQRGAVQRPAVPTGNPAVVTPAPPAESIHEATSIGPHPALTRITPATQESVVTLALTQRFVVEVRVTPSTTATDATRIAAALPLSAIEALAVPAPPGPSTADDNTVPSTLP